MADDDVWECAAGRTAFFDGAWTAPCGLPTEHHHVIIAVDTRIELCDTHFAEVNAAGLISDPYVSEEEAARLEEQDRRRTEQGRGRL